MAAHWSSPGPMGQEGWELIRIHDPVNEPVCELPRLISGNGMAWAGQLGARMNHEEPNTTASPRTGNGAQPPLVLAVATSSTSRSTSLTTATARTPGRWPA